MTQFDTAAPRLDGRWVYLRPLTEADYGFLFALTTSNEVAFRLRYRGQPPRPETFAESLWQGTFAQYLICRVSTDELVGHVFAYRPDLSNGTAFIGLAVAPQFHGQGWPLEGMHIFIDYLFRMWNFRKLYGESLGFNVVQFRHASFAEEGRLLAHEFYAGRYWDLVILAIYREQWERSSPKQRMRRSRRSEVSKNPQAVATEDADS